MASEDLAKLVVKLEAQTAQYDRALKKATSELRQFSGSSSRFLYGLGSQFTTLAKRALSFGAAFASVNKVFESISRGDDLAKFAQKTGLAANAATELAHVAQMADIDLGGLGAAFKKMQTSISEAATGSKSVNQALQALGLTVADLQSLHPDKQFETLADRIARLEDPADRTRAAVELFGRAGADLLPLFEQGAEGIRKGREEAIALGKSLNEIDLQRLQEADDAIKRMKASTEALSTTIASKLAPHLAAAADSIRAIFGGETIEEKLKAEVALAGQELQAFSGLTGSIREQNSDQIVRATERYAKALEALNDYRLNQSIASANGMAAPTPIPGFAPSEGAAGKLSKSELDEWERFANQGTQIANDQAAAFNSIAPVIEENERALAQFFAQVNESNIEATSRVIEFGQVYEAQSETISVAAQAAATQIEGAFASFFMNFDKGIKGMAQGFIRALQQMVSNLLASQLMQFLGAGLAGSSNSFLSGIGKALTVPGRASGGPVSAGHLYMINEKGQEYFAPGSDGRIIPAGAGMGLNYAPVINAQGADKELRAALPGILAEDKRRFFELLQDQRSRGR